MAKILNDKLGKLKPFEGDIDLMIALRLQAARAEEDSKILRERADEVFLGLVNLLNLDTVETDEGTYKWISKAGSERLDKKKLKEFLLQKGFDSDMINEAFASATTVGKEVKYAAFYQAKGRQPE